MIEKLDYKNLIVIVFCVYLLIIGIVSYSILLNFFDSLTAFFYSSIGSSFLAIIIDLFTVQYILYNLIEINRTDYLTILSNKDFEAQFSKLSIKNSKVTVNQFNKAIDLYNEFLKQQEDDKIHLFKVSLTEKESYKFNNKKFINI